MSGTGVKSFFFQAPKEAHIPFFNGMMAFAITPEKKNTLLAR